MQTLGHDFVVPWRDGKHFESISREPDCRFPRVAGEPTDGCTAVQSELRFHVDPTDRAGGP